jgi:hypothetical protein
LAPSPEAQAAHRHKAIYATLRPKTKQGTAFSTATAESRRQGRGAARRAAARGEALGENLKFIEGKSLDKGVEMDALRKSSFSGRSSPGLSLSVRVEPADKGPSHRNRIRNNRLL